MNNSRRNGLRTDDDIDEGLIAEEDILQVVELEPNNSQDVAADLDMLDVNTADADDCDAAIETDPLHDDAKLYFSKHKGSVFCVAVDTEHGEFAATGGEDDKAFLWKIATGEMLLESTGHKDSVTCVCFSSGSTYLATGDLAGSIKVWGVKQLELIWSFEVSDLEWLSWHPAAPILLAGTKDGHMWMWRIPDGTTKTFQSFGHSCATGRVMPDGKRCVAGYEDGSVRVWDLKAVTPLHAFSGHQAHRSLVTCLSCHNDNNIVLTGSTDCTAILYNTSSGKMLSQLQCKVLLPDDGMDPNDDSVETVGLSNVLAYAATGTLSGHLQIWDVPTQVCRQQCKHDSGIVKLSWHECQPLVYTCTLEGVVHLWDARTGDEERHWMGHEASILDMQVIKDGSTIVTASDDQTARVFTL